jgi:hypothetical protein|tara:strand:+ start:2170 stop:2562 length:393 start_codon:yes stop_codon:yes gene_type:complete
MFKRTDIMKQALEDPKSIKNILPKGVSVIGRGVKIQQFDDEIQILNMGKGGDYFKECSDEEYVFFFEDGWRKGCTKVSMSNCLHKLSIIESRIKTELNTRKNDKHIQNLKNRRETLLIKYTNLKTELNKI